MSVMADLLKKIRKVDNFYKVCDIAKEHGYKLTNHNKEHQMLSFQRGNAIVVVSLTRFTVMTTITHPKKGRKQLTRSGLDIGSLAEIFKNPRVHTGKGYFSKKDLVKYAKQKNTGN